MKLNHLRDVLAVAEYGSLRAAGRHLRIAQPAISRSIREMEHELGVALFERNVKGAKLTSTGMAFIKRARAIQSEVQRARDEIEQIKGHSTGEVSVGMSTASAMVIMPAVLQDFRKRFPDSVLKMSETLFQPIEPELLDGTVDFYVGPLDPDYSSPQLSVEWLFENRRMVMARKGHPLASATSLKQLVDAKWIRPTLSTRNTEADFDIDFEQLGLPKPNVVLHARSALITLIAVTSSDLLTVLPKQWLDIAETANLLCALDIVEPMYVPPMCIVRRHDMPLTPMAEHFCDLIRRAGTQYAKVHKLKVHERPRENAIP
jgi:DNA-binding transcriptional LysR family regulator